MFLQLWQTQTSFEQPSVFFTCWLGVGCQSNFGKEGSKRAGYLSSGSSPAFSCLQLIINVSFGVSYMLSPKLLQSHLTLCNPVDCSPPGFSVHGILQARVLEWVAMPSSRGSSQPKDWTQVSHIADGFFTIWSRWPNIIVNFYFMSLGFTRWHCSISGLPIYTILQSISIVNLYSISLRTLN